MNNVEDLITICVLNAICEPKGQVIDQLIEIII